MPAPLALLAAWVEPTDGPHTAAYVQFANFSKIALTITSIESPAAQAVRFVDGDPAAMRHGFTILPLQALRMHPGGARLELHGIRRPLRFGQRLPFVVHLADGTRMRIVALVRFADGVQSRRLRPVASRALRSA